MPAAPRDGLMPATQPVSMRATRRAISSGPNTPTTTPRTTPARSRNTWAVSYTHLDVYKRQGVCRSDWHAWLGHDPVPLPMVPGHEFAGTVAAVGADVRRWRVGDRVTVPFACGCGVCEVCRAGDTHVCPSQTQPGFTGWGSFAELVAVSAADANVVGLPESVGFVEAAALGCRLATAYRAVVSVGLVARGEWLVVHGCGGVCLLYTSRCV